MFYIESSCTGHFMCSDTHYCLGLKETGELMWTRDGGLYPHKHLESVWFLNLHVAAESNQTVSHRPQTPFLVF